MKVARRFPVVLPAWLLLAAGAAALALAGRPDLLAPDGAVGPAVRLKLRLGLAALGAAGLAAGGLGLRHAGACAAALRALAGSFRALAGDARAWARNWPRAVGRAHVAALGVIVLAGVALRAAYLDAPMRNDEAFSFLEYASQPFAVIVATYTRPNNHVFHTLLMRAACLLGGDAPAVLRMPCFLAGVLIVPLGYLVALRFFGRHAALAGAALLASSSALVEFSVNGRGYALVALFFLVMMLCAGVLCREASPAAWVVLALTGALGLYTVPVMLYPAAIVFLFLAAATWREPDPVRRRARWAGLLAAGAGMAFLAAALYGPILLFSGWRALAANANVQSHDYGFLFAAAYQREKWGALAALWSRDLPWELAVALAAGLAAAAGLRPARGREGRAWLGAAAAALALLILAQRVIPPARVVVRATARPRRRRRGLGGNGPARAARPRARLGGGRRGAAGGAGLPGAGGRGRARRVRVAFRPDRVFPRRRGRHAVPARALAAGRRVAG